jgi:hypothetical protein
LDIRSIEFTTSFLEFLAGLGENARQGALDSLKLEAAEIAPNVCALFAGDDSVVGWMVVHAQDGSPAHFALKLDPDQIDHS